MNLNRQLILEALNQTEGSAYENVRLLIVETQELWLFQCATLAWLAQNAVNDEKALREIMVLMEQMRE